MGNWRVAIPSISAKVSTSGTVEFHRLPSSESSLTNGKPLSTWSSIYYSSVLCFIKANVVFCFHQSPHRVEFLIHPIRRFIASRPSRFPIRPNRHHGRGRRCSRHAGSARRRAAQTTQEAKGGGKATRFVPSTPLGMGRMTDNFRCRGYHSRTVRAPRRKSAPNRDK